ncbi:undecaprenyl phosphate-alpha-L-ara4N flippase subunit ArnE [Pseudomonas sp. NFPP07]|jgi:undecaprenyl phosphate-alpha-L-ara4N flippase subunit ArnE|uniref:4-amino-4-deoxy-L-arabinose-phosphoundecaprenol flippase subunit ArnE n=1 Tax=Pseudomonas TaxID=286 RepID=UPI0008ED09E0|nr:MULTISPECIES: 4-amino-4-deoxy-L-arabinose-phosphoundecaprenol flippase subunit ArnE [Pseudomonas]PXX72980.1 undecaprenyl phosphate-alpha-L-ara4N flippase subunit ArnE [Pseudomonas sp. LAMO17WK12:I9]WDH50429.1 4-amino-4-deoxy-L-arabinose-phosphoundecaprenol flippase subunit ArnE [Pseudomonas chlororaphis]SFQ27503.1 undecaprenyl phosphate-alpha-L-ara4N flippase subunit ArnE [Pseudomonas sp. NFPP07]SNY27742.1 undecaprenyl phosphate-alpha-L-ara4N flippase subunit ArnE [Pseudomonas sp. LAMO17WK12
MSLLLLLAACLLTCLGQIAQKFAVESWRGQPSGALDKLRSPWLWLALASLGLGLLVWLLVLQRVEVGIAYPMLSLNFVLITLIARFVFHETIDRRHWLGVALVLAGVLLLSRHA